MFKIASYILVAACINFQEVVTAASLLSNPLGSLGSLGSLRPLGSLLDKGKDKESLESLLNNGQDKTSDTGDQLSDFLHNVLERGSETIQKIEDGAIKISKGFDSRLSAEIQRLQNKSEQFLKEAEDADISSCSRLCKKSRAALANLVSQFDTCLLNETRQVGEGIQDLIDVIGELQKNLPGQIQDMIQCVTNSGISGIGSCITKGLKDIAKLGIPIKQAISAGVEFVSFYPNLKMCCEKTIFQFIPNLFDLLPDVGTCIQSTVRKIF